jgi:peptide chain release factor 1
MFDKLGAVENRFLEIESKLSDPSLADRPDEFRRLSKEHSSLQEIVDEYRIYKKLKSDISSNKEMLAESDDEISAMAKE